MNWSASISKYVQAHLPHFIFVSVLFLIGAVFGSILVNALTIEQQEEMTQYLHQFIQNLDVYHTDNNALMDEFVVHLKWVVGIWLLGLSVIGMPVVLILIFIKGLLIGFSIGYLVSEMSWKGMLFALASIAPQNSVIIPVLLVCAVASMSFSIHLIRNRFFRYRNSHAHPLPEYVLIAVIATVMMFGISLFEVKVTPILINWIMPWMVR